MVLRIARELGMQPIMWNVTGYDWNAPPAAAIESKVSKQIRGGDVILLHDGGHKAMGADRSQTVLATEHLIQRYKAEGYEFVTIPQMLAKSSERMIRIRVPTCLASFASHGTFRTPTNRNPKMKRLLLFLFCAPSSPPLSPNRSST